MREQSAVTANPNPCHIQEGLGAEEPENKHIRFCRKEEKNKIEPRRVIFRANDPEEKNVELSKPTVQTE